ncbi:MULTISPECIES: LysR family transcriptional regulator [Sphingomonas]|uniref:LysR family transcriptional regulator n=1 Tax=Sphingomonas kyungheensis TaxID=1069987 RepID=A0ABU8H5X0_9SPHN|nr:LysR family transcriptional regulator [Sphingomonas sp. RIT328]EZP48757.1 Transcriptional regulator, LysR family [Sphingomonas sp. RIT328]
MQSEPAKTHGPAALPWSDLQSFLAIAESGQLARAAQVMGVDASTMGRRLRRLEKRLGQTLFEQSRSGHLPTSAGERLLAQVRAMQRAAEPIQRQPDAGGITGLLRVSVSEGFGTWIVAPLLRAFTAEHPQLTIDLAATSGFLNPSRREADMAILLARPRSGPVVSRKLADYSLRLYANPRFLAERPPIDSVAALAGLPLIGYIPDLLYAPELRYLDEIGEGLEPTLRSSSINAQYRLIAAAAGIGVLPRFIGDASADLVPVLPERQIRRTFWIVTHQDTRRLARVQAFQSWLIAQVEQQRERLLG